MGVPHITSFCWCLGLEQGSKLVGIIHLLTALFLMSVASVFAKHFGENMGTIEDAEDQLYTAWYNISVVVVGLSVVHVVLAGILIYGSFKRNTTALRLWVWVMVSLSAAALAYVVYSMTFGFTTTGSHIFLAFLEGTVFFGTLSYCVLCVNSFYLMLKSSEEMDTPYKTDY